MPVHTNSSGQIVVPLWINSEALPLGNDGKTFPVTSSRSGKQIHHAHSVDETAANAACEAAWEAFGSWKRSAPSTRRGMLNKVADIFERRKEEMINSQMDETSCDRGWAINNVTLSVNYLREIAASVSSVMGQIPMNDKPGTLSFVFKEPVGPILTIPPWNAALVLATRAITSALGAGCTVVLKASELSPLTHHMIVEAFEEAREAVGAPKGILNQVQAAREDAARITELLIANERIRKIEFIGSAAVGRIVGSVAAKHLKPVLMELGGKCPAIVLEDADLEMAAELCAKGATMHHGQICFSTERILVQSSILKKFLPLLASAIKANGSPGLAVHSGIASQAQALLEDAHSCGASFLVNPNGPAEADETGLQPEIILSPPPKAHITDTESFGPFATLYPFDTDEQAISRANSSAYGLNATIHTKDLARAIGIARELEYGQIHINSISVYTSPTGPQGGVKGSGWGRQNAGWGLSEFVVERFVSWHGSGQ